MMAYIINKALLKKYLVVIALLDLKIFGDVHYNLIRNVLAYHHIPDSIQNLVESLYTEVISCIITENFATPAIPLSREVLEGNCLRPLYLLFASIHLSNSLSRKNISSSVLHHKTKMIAYSIPLIGFNFRMMQWRLLLIKAKINCY